MQIQILNTICIQTESERKQHLIFIFFGIKMKWMNSKMLRWFAWKL